MTTNENDPNHSVALAAGIVSAYVAGNTVPARDLPTLIRNVQGALADLLTIPTEPVAEQRAPAVPLKRSVTDDYIVCLEDGKRFKTLKRHLMVHYDMTPAEYRTKWSLPASYPMVAPAYAARRSAIARSLGLGRKKGERAPSPVVAKRGRKKREG